MGAFIDNKKISEFRDFVNTHQDFMISQYCNKNGKNLWNIICSCMDWIAVATRQLQSFESPNIQSEIDIRTMQMYSFISSIDIIYEAILQLHRIFINKKTLPFKGDDICFAKKIYDEDDNSYFKSIRASFGAHPVNLTTCDERKRYASWPFEEHGELAVLLYSNEIDEPDLIMHLKKSELVQFLQKIYNYLDVITKNIQEKYKAFHNKYTKQSIESTKNHLKQLHILLTESEKRLNNDHYNDVIRELIKIYEADLQEAALNNIALDYKNSLTPLIDEIKENLQSMEIKDLEYSFLLTPKIKSSKEIGYIYMKFISTINSVDHDPQLPYYIQKLNESKLFKVHFSIVDHKNVLLLKSKLLL